MALSTSPYSVVDKIGQSPPLSPSQLSTTVTDTTFLKDKTILITGGASGFGAGFFRRWAAAGANVVIGDINVQKGDQLVRDIKKETGNENLHFFYCDVANWQSQVSFFKNVVKVSPHGGIDTVVANAGIVNPKETFENPKDIDATEPLAPDLKVLDVNLKGVLYTAHLALWHLPRNPGSGAANRTADPAKTMRDRHLVLISSMAGLAPIPTQTLYATSKHAVVGLYRNLRASSFVHGVRTSLICPYFTDTPIVSAGARLLLAGGVVGKVEDVVEAATRFVVDPSIVGRAVMVGPKLKARQEDDGKWVLVEKKDEDQKAEEMAIQEIYANDFEEVELFTRRLVGVLNRAMHLRGWTGWLRDVVAAFRFKRVAIRGLFGDQDRTWSPVWVMEGEMPDSISSMRVESGSDPYESYVTAASQVPYGAASASFRALSNHGSPRIWHPAKRVGFFACGPNKIAWIMATIIATMILIGTWNARYNSIVHRPDYLTKPYRGSYNTTTEYSLPFQPPEPVDHRSPDTIDTFATYKYRNTCNISSLDLHVAFSPLCTNRKDLIQAMSGGGRIGFDAPYMPRGCDMRWFSTEEVCEILARFEKVIILGDSMMRHVIGSINVLIRKDLGYGAVTDWNFSPEERRDCFCNYQFNVKACSIQGIFKTADVVKNDPESVTCPAGSIDVMIEQMIRFPIAPEELARLRTLLPAKKPSKPYAFIFGHGLWNDLDLQATLDWLDKILETVNDKAPWLAPNSPAKSSPTTPGHHDRKRGTGFFPRLFLTPNAAGKEKPDEWIQSQGNKALMVFEESVKVEAGRRGVEHLGTWNATIQSNKFDGVHVDLKGNLVKAMMVLNWLNMLEVEKF